MKRFMLAYYSWPSAVVLHICVELELVSLESNCKVALGDPVPASLESHLVTGQPALVAHYCCAVDGCTIDVVVNITAKVDVFTLVAWFDLAALLAGMMWRGNKRALMSEEKQKKRYKEERFIKTIDCYGFV